MNSKLLSVIGLTGSIGSGKTTVGAIMQKFGGYVLDADKINHRIMESGKPAYEEIVHNFGTKILDEKGEINRSILASIVFDPKNESKRLKLQEITHNYVVREIFSKIGALQNENNDYKFIVIDAPLLIEANIHDSCDKVVVVEADEMKRISRVVNRDNTSPEKVLSRINALMSPEELRKYADFIFTNNGNLDNLESSVKGFLINELRIEI